MAGNNVISKLRRFWWLLLLVLIMPEMAWGADFSAMMIVKDGPKTFPGKIYVSNGKMRQEFVDEQGQTVTIVRPDKKVVWVIIPPHRSYLEMPLKTRLPGQFIQIPPQATAKRLVGHDRVEGYEADKYQVTVLGDRKCEFQTYWVAPKLGLPIKMECRERQFSLEYKNIKEGKVPDRLFDLPPGYPKATSPQGFDNDVEK
jgi:outer membrane lipoprotein-sorting protein